MFFNCGQDLSRVPMDELICSKVEFLGFMNCLEWVYLGMSFSDFEDGLRVVIID